MAKKDEKLSVVGRLEDPDYGREYLGEGEKNELRPIVVTTSHRGVFFGYTTDSRGQTVKLKDGRMCVYWADTMKGFMGLAAYGPDTKCRIGPPADIEVRDVTSVCEVSIDAAERWEEAPWHK